MRATLLLPVLAAGLISLTACDFEDWGDTGRFSSDFHQSYPLNADGHFSLESFNGSVDISGWDQDTVDISGTKYGPTQSVADNIRVTFDHRPDSVSIHAERPYDRRNEGVRFVIKVPRASRIDRVVSSNGGIRLTGGAGPAHVKSTNGAVHVEDLKGSLNAETSNGRIELVNVSGDVVAHTTNGRIQTEGLVGSLDASTSNGAIRGEISRGSRDVHAQTSNGPIELTLPADFTADLHAHTSNGAITLRLPSESNARVEARTSNSSITSDFEVRASGEISKHQLNGTIGSGGPLFDLTTSNGSIRLLKM